MFGLGFSEVIAILVVVLVVFGPDRLPEIAKQLGKMVGEFRRSVDDLKNEVHRAGIDVAGIDVAGIDVAGLNGAGLDGKGLNLESPSTPPSPTAASTLPTAPVAASSEFSPTAVSENIPTLDKTAPVEPPPLPLHSGEFPEAHIPYSPPNEPSDVDSTGDGPETADTSAPDSSDRSNNDH